MVAERAKPAPYHLEGVLEAGCDEAGRGPLAGPVVAAAVILPFYRDGKNYGTIEGNPLFTHPRLTDSKQLTAKQREELRPLIIEHSLAYGIARVEADVIDRINILKASILAMHQALTAAEQMLLTKIAAGQTPPCRLEHIIVDGNRFTPYTSIEGAVIEHDTIVKGDSKYISIAAASILAKTERDQIMISLSEKYPQYGWDKNMAYPSAAHLLAIKKYGPTPHHRMTYGPLKELTLF